MFQTSQKHVFCSFDGIRQPFALVQKLLLTVLTTNRWPDTASGPTNLEHPDPDDTHDALADMSLIVPLYLSQ
jgi:hypothetical protein